MSRVAVVTLGCPKNSVDSESLGGLLASSGHEVSDEVSSAEVVVVNTCGFIDAARRETIQEVLDLAELKEEGSLKGLVLTGCLVARSAQELADSLPEVDAFVDFAAYPRISSIVTDISAGTLSERVYGEPGTRFDPAWWDQALISTARVRFGRLPWSYLKIAEGCDRGCTFCAIPLMRGRFSSRNPEVIENEARTLVAHGVSELSLVSQDSVRWGRDLGDERLVDLLARLERIEGLRRVRLMYLHPQGVTDELVDAMLSSEVVTPYFDLSLQHVSGRVLRGMGRPGNRRRFVALIEGIRERSPVAGIRSSFIVGFPSEQEEDVAELELFISEAGLDWIGCFTYSRESGTRSFDMDQLPEEVISERFERVTRAAEVAMEGRAASLQGEVLEVLAERYERAENVWIGRSHREAPEIDGDIRFEAPTTLAVGDYLDVLVTEAQGAELVGVAVNESRHPLVRAGGRLGA
ncbi:MAG: 30S ribosomal protein S12 methylthiotransferase RimO [Actinomycetota bacterium]